MLTYVLGFLMVTMAAQAALGWFQIKRMYQSMEDLKRSYRHTPYILAIGSAKSGLTSVSYTHLTLPTTSRV